jgi:chromosome partitioning protein
MRTLLVASQKGGVGKTTTAVNIAALAAKAGGRVLLLDADPLGSVAASLHLSRAAGEDTPAPRPDGVTRRGAIWANVVPNLDVVSPYPDGDTAEAHLHDFLQEMPTSTVARFYDTVIIDAPPMLGPRPKALLKAASEVLIVQRAEPMSFRTLPAYLELIQEARNEGARVKLRGVLMTLPNGVTPGGKAELRMRERFQGLIPHSIPHDAEVNRALLLGKPVTVSAPQSAVSKQYITLAGLLGLTNDVVKAAPVVAAAAAPARKAAAANASDGGVAVLEAPAATATLTPPPRTPGLKDMAKPLSLSASEKGYDATDENRSGVAFALAASVAVVGIGLAAWFLMK